jgi:hypothetical protein
MAALVALVPFEALSPLVTFPGQSVSTSEAALPVALLGLLAAAGWSGSALVWRTPVTRPALVALGALLVSALASAHRANAVHMVGRFALACAAGLIAVNAARDVRRLEALLRIAAAAGAMLSALVIADYLGIDFVRAILRPFRPHVALVGDQVRASGPFGYPTIASMYLEILFALTLGAVWVAVERRQALAACAALAAGAAIAQAIVLTFTRAGIVTMGSSLALAVVARCRARGADVGLAAYAALALVLMAALAWSRPSDAMRLRFATETQERWYRAAIDAPQAFELRAGETAAVPLTLVNTGRATWDPAGERPFRLSYHWLSADGTAVVDWEGARTELPRRVGPGETVTLAATVRAPGREGRYRLLWDMELVNRLWFSTEPDSGRASSDVVVTGSLPAAARGAGALDGAGPPLPQPAVRPGRLVLWGAALKMFAAHPMLGVGPDNYRLLYGEYAGLAKGDARVHSNNLYLELLVSGGLLGALACGWLFVAAVRQFRALVPRLWSAGSGGPAVAVVAAGAAVALHGVVDVFLAFTATYVLMAFVIGLAVASHGAAGTHANRV